MRGVKQKINKALNFSAFKNFFSKTFDNTYIITWRKNMKSDIARPDPYALFIKFQCF